MTDNKEKYILHFGNLAGWPYKLAEAMRARDIPALHAIYKAKESHKTLDRRYNFDRFIFHERDNFFSKALKLNAFLKEVTRDCKLVHYHSSNIFQRELHWLYEGKALSNSNIPMLMTFGGGDIRSVVSSRKRNIHFPHYSVIDTWRREIRRKARLKSWSKYLKFAATDPEFYDELKPYFEKVFIFRQPVDVNQIDCVLPDISREVPVVLHIPTEPEIKGTKYVIAAVERLKNEGYKFEFVQKISLPHEEMIKAIKEADIYIDDLCIGAHGQTPVETMSAGKPTLTNIRPDLVPAYPSELPLVNTNPDTIYDNLKELILDPGRRHEVGMKGRDYAMKYHDVNKVIDDLLEIYKEIGGWTNT